MTTNAPHRSAPSARPRHPERHSGKIAALQRAQARRRRWRYLLAILAALTVVGVVTVMALTSRPTSSAATRLAPTFSLTNTVGDKISLAGYRGQNVLLYFSEGAGCGACLQQMAAIEKDQPAFTQAGVTVLPIVMNTRDQITRDMATYGVKTPFLLDDGTVSKEYGTLGKGMHEGLPGHSFILIDKTGTQRWYGEYPSMWLSPAEVLSQINKHLAATSQ